MQVEDNGIYRVKFVAGLLDVHRSTVYRAIESGQLEVLRVGTGKGALRIKGFSLNNWIAACSEGGATPAADNATGDNAAEVA
ncbi:helix-turn-helix domain-containing protein [Amycolatopsis sp. DSM 110486]|uniref:helix-turn-helix domain-containing protein n=1 Tax=Amycolatopsis sp. DSM 110486 TaxID=2865832 RepID=UPI001C69859F|nr:helix-turn-helix domain-containing protein [Amycolatopsis sp. DSM 110486]QYN23741.1 helix-turn-helix domain-containing protein [Amycolatopsis sp. DSM 110486]